jgi:pimeloyl-ACP methyl ester carboxylesterase
VSFMQAHPEFVEGPGGRKLRIDVTGHPEGKPVFLMHGTPGSHKGPRPRSIVLYRMGIRLISYDRPGYGESDRHEGRHVADAAADVAAIADQLDIGAFAVVGRSGGGPHALACAAILAGRITRAAVLVSLAPANAIGLDWYAGMSELNIDEYTAADQSQQELIDDVTARVNSMQDDPEALVRFLDPALWEADRRVTEDLALRRLITESHQEAIRVGPYGWIDDTLAFRRPWGFRLESITAPVCLWHGLADAFSPASHTQWLASRIPNATVAVEPNAGHFAAVEKLPEILNWLTAAERDDLVRVRVKNSGNQLLTRQ